VTIFANSRQHALAQQYLDMVKKAVSSQVLIEAKVLEVNLSDQFSTGINWQSLSSAVGWDVTFSGAQGLARPAIPDSFGGFSLGYVRNTGENAETSLVEALSRFGTVKALASPRLTVLNNQAASLVVAKNQVFFNVDVEVQPATQPGGTSLTTVSSEIQSVPVGVLINVFPSIDVARDEVTMSVRPTITKIDDFVVDPGSAYAAALAGQQNPNLNTSDLVSQVPVTNVQEIDSIVQMKSGQAVLMGGLIQDNAESTTNGGPVLSELPGVGALFRNQVDSVSKTELVIMLKATIISSGGETIHDTDKEFYKAFAQDRRPFNLDGNK
jgi:general secretion pathway protein D